MAKGNNGNTNSGTASNENDDKPVADKEGLLNKRFELWKTLLAVGIPALATIIVSIITITKEKKEQSPKCIEIFELESRIDNVIVRCLDKLDATDALNIDVLTAVDSVLRVAADQKFRRLSPLKMACEKKDFSLFAGDLRRMQIVVGNLESALLKE